MSLLKKLAVGYSVAFAGLGLGATYFVHRVKESQDQPKEFTNLAFPNNAAALFERPTKTSLALEDLVKQMFTQRLYQLEYLLSGTQFNDDFTLQVGSKIGHMVVESQPNPDQVIFRYIYPGFNYRMFFEKSDDRLKLGFVDYTDSKVQDWGCRFYLPILLEGLARKVEKK